MFEKFAFQRKTSPSSTRVEEGSSSSSRVRNEQKTRIMNREELTTEVPNHLTNIESDEDLMNTAIRTESQDEGELSTSTLNRSGHSAEDKNDHEIHTNGNTCNGHSGVKSEGVETLREKLVEIFPDSSSELIKHVAESSNDYEAAVEIMIALKEEETQRENDIISKKKKKTKRKRVRAHSESDSDLCSTPKKRLKHPHPVKTHTSVTSSQNQNQELKETLPGKSQEESLGVYRNSASSSEAAIVLSDSSDECKSEHKSHKAVKENCKQLDTIELSDGDDNYHDNQSDEDDDGLDGTDMAAILSFLDSSSKEELTEVPEISISKAKKLINLRPFDSWKDLKSKLINSKGVSEKIIWNCHTLLEKRSLVLKLLEKCESLSKGIQDIQTTNLNDKENVAITQPEILNKSCKLKPYQLTGLNWLILMHKQKMNGILADEMGLGKTIQAIAFIAHLIEQGDDGPYLIVAPASTVDNWAKEVKRWCPTINYIKYYGSMVERQFLREEILFSHSEIHVIITTYQMIVSTPDDRRLFRKLKSHYVIFDEGHMLKNMQSQRYRNLINIRAKRRLLLTGTPLQNNLLELMSLLNFIMPTMFDESLEGLRILFSKKQAEKSNVTYEKERLRQAKRIMKPFVLRRLKKDVLHQLPQKHEEVVICELSAKQRLLYDKVFLECYKKYKEFGSSSVKKNIMMPLRMTANHPMLLRDNFTDAMLTEMTAKYCRDIANKGCEAALVNEDMTVMTDFELHRLCMAEITLLSYALQKETILDSGKFNYLDSILPTMREQGDRVLLFSQFTLVMDVIEVFLEHKKYKFLRLDGSTKVTERQSLIDKFNNDPDIFIFLLSTKAGGLGINLTSANVVILHDIDYNPYNDKQAEDRCHRVGQERDVRVYKLISKNTIEEGMLSCAKSKLQLEKDVVSNENDDDVDQDMAGILGQTFESMQIPSKIQ